MNLAAIFAFLLTSGICAETEFHSPDGARLTVMVCPRVVAGDPPAEAEPPPRPAPPAHPERRT